MRSSSRCSFCPALRARRSTSWGRIAPGACAVQQGKEAIAKAFQVMFRGQAVKSWHGIKAADAARARTSLVGAHKAMVGHDLAPSKLLGSIPTDCFRQGLRSQ
eukprot:1261028-Pyramimonas_sp.AAC.1